MLSGYSEGAHVTDTDRPNISDTEMTDMGDSSFQQFVRTSLCDILSRLEEMQKGQDKLEGRLDDLETKLGDVTLSIDFNFKSISDVKIELDTVKSSLNECEQKTNKTSNEIMFLKDKLNKAERNSRRNNFRIIGVMEKQKENVFEWTMKLLVDKFGFVEPQIERAHRDGKKLEGQPRHILVKMLRYKDKTMILKQARGTLQGAPFHICDDLTKPDLDEKRKWKTQVQEAYKRGLRYRFYSGKWRTLQGAIVNFNH